MTFTMKNNRKSSEKTSRRVPAFFEQLETRQLFSVVTYSTVVASAHCAPPIVATHTTSGGTVSAPTDPCNVG